MTEGIIVQCDILLKFRGGKGGDWATDIRYYFLSGGSLLQRGTKIPQEILAYIEMLMGYKIL